MLCFIALLAYAITRLAIYGSVQDSTKGLYESSQISYSTFIDYWMQPYKTQDFINGFGVIG